MPKMIYKISRLCGWRTLYNNKMSMQWSHPCQKHCHLIYEDAFDKEFANIVNVNIVNITATMSNWRIAVNCTCLWLHKEVHEIEDRFLEQSIHPRSCHARRQFKVRAIAFADIRLNSIGRRGRSFHLKKSTFRCRPFFSDLWHGIALL